VKFGVVEREGRGKVGKLIYRILSKDGANTASPYTSPTAPHVWCLISVSKTVENMRRSEIWDTTAR
jgi:hypothetical protein